MIRDIPDDGQVTEPGAYKMSMALYHSQKVCPGPSISSSGLRTITTKSPHAFWKSSAWNENRYPEKPPSDALILGRAAHALMLGDEVFDEHFVYVPEDAPRRPTATQIAAFERTGAWSDAAKDGAAFWEAFDKKAEGRMLLAFDTVQRIAYMAENLNACPEAITALTGQMTEISLIWQDEATGLWVKSRPDCLPSNGVDGGDLKTFTPKGGDVVLAAQRASTEHGYPQQMALVQEGAERVWGVSAEKFALIFIQTTAPFEVVPQMLDEEALYWGRVQNRKALDEAAHGLKTGEWPFRARGFTNYSYPPSMLHAFGEMQLRGDLPNVAR